MTSNRGRSTAVRISAAGVLAAAVSIASAACGRKDTQPTKVEREPSVAKADRKTPFRDPKHHPPGPRTPAELAEAELASHIEKARAEIASGDWVRAMQMLYRCANKTPPSVRCEGELGMLLLEHRTRKAHADYFVAEAVRIEEPDVDSDFYRRLASMARSRARFEVALAAIDRVIDRGEATAEDHVTRARILQSDRERIHDAIAALEKAWEMKPEDPEWLLERATLIAQTPEAEAAIELLEEYEERFGDDGEHSAMIAERIATLRAAVEKPKKDGPSKPPRARHPVPGR